MENAIVMASGMGMRMRPLTEKMPKPLIAVHGKPMIETVIEGLQRRGVDRIFVVVGYLGEQFMYLKKKYSNIQLVWNGVYETVNNISSIYFARDVLRKGDCFICEADLFISDTSVFNCNLENSCYFGTMVKGYSEDWVLEQNSAGRIVRVGKKGSDCYNMVGISFFKAKDAVTLAEVIESAYGKEGYETLFWDDVVNRNLDRIDLYVHSVEKNQIIEIDTIEELERTNHMVEFFWRSK